MSRGFPSLPCSPGLTDRAPTYETSRNFATPAEAQEPAVHTGCAPATTSQCLSLGVIIWGTETTGDDGCKDRSCLSSERGHRKASHEVTHKIQQGSCWGSRDQRRLHPPPRRPSRGWAGPAPGAWLGCEHWLDSAFGRPGAFLEGTTRRSVQSHLSSLHLLLRFSFSSHLSTSWPQSGLLFPA